MKKTLKLLIIIALISCGQNNKDSANQLKEIHLIPFQLIITDSDYSLAYGLQYVLTEKDLSIIFKGGIEGEKDTVLSLTDLQPTETLMNLSDLNLDRLNDYYTNPCIDDGSQISVNFKRGNKFKQIHLSNYYQKDIGLAIEFINGLVPEKYEIWYNKDKLLQDQKNCEEG
jgi:hypothetical protein